MAKKDHFPCGSFSCRRAKWHLLLQVKRVRANAQVSLQPCDVRGRVRPGSTKVHGTARVVTPQENPQDLAAVEKAVNKKYGIVSRFVNLSSFLKGMFRRQESNGAAIIVRLSL